MTEEKLKLTLTKIDQLEIAIRNNSKYSIETKRRY
jgi:hypothetical protein